MLVHSRNDDFDYVVELWVVDDVQRFLWRRMCTSRRRRCCLPMT